MDGRARARFGAASGRERELAVLHDTWLDARQQARPAFARVHGPAGIGKSHLLRALVRRLAGDGAPVVEACADRSRGEALALIRQLARGLLAVAAEGGGAPAELAALTARLAPILEAAPPPRARRPQDLRLDVADALAGLLRRCLAEAPVLVLDDLDAADAGSLELLRYLVTLLRQPGAAGGCLVVFSWREADERLAELARLPCLDLLLAPLDPEGVRDLLSRPDVAEQLWAATSGDPSRLAAVLGNAPADLGLRRVQRLDGDQKRLLLAAAVVCHAAPALLLGRIAEVADAPALLERLVADGFLLVEVDASGPGYRFAREADRQSVLEAAGPSHRARFHLAAAEALEAAGAPPEEIARHHLAGDPRGSGAAWAFRAAEHLAARCAFDAAIEFFHAALDGEGMDRRAIHLGLATAYEATGDLIAALRHLGLSRRNATAEERRAARSEAARLCIRIGKLAQAERLCRIVLDGRTCLDPADPAAARAWVDFAEIRFLRSDYEGAAAAAEAGIARAAELPALRVALRNTLGKTLLGRGRYEEAAAAFRANAVESDEAGLQRESMLARINEGVAWHRNGDRERAIRLYREGLALGDDRGLVALTLGNLAVLYHEVGEFSLALEHYASALAAFTLVRRSEGVAHQGLNRARLLLFLGDLAAAREGAEHAAAEAERLGSPYLVAQAALVRGELALHTGDALAAVAEIEAARAGFERVGNPRYQVESEIALARARLAAGDREAAAAAVLRLDELAAARGSADLTVERAVLAAEVAMASGAPARALEVLEKAREAVLSRPRGVGGETDLEGPWRIYDLLARAHETLGRHEAAAAHRVRARALLEELAGRIPAAWRERFLSRPERARLLASTDGEFGTGHVGQVRQVAAAPAVATGQTIVGEAPALRQLLRRVAPLGRSLLPVLLRGESGTGKDLVAAALHAASPRAALPLIKVGCSARGEEALLVELFGRERGAGAERRGRLEQANGGALYLDEVAALTPRLQEALLRVLEEKAFERVGGTEPIPVDVRLILASSRNLEELLESGAFREDLYYRLKGASLELPPLRARKGDIPALATHFLQRAREERGGGPSRFSPEALSLLAAWDWPGNVRELENLVAAVAVFAEDDVVGMEAFELHGEFIRAVRAAGPAAPQPAEHGPIDFYALAQARGIGVRELRQELEQQMISRALLEAKGNISEAARLLQMKRSRLSQIVNAEPELLALARGAA